MRLPIYLLLAYVLSSPTVDAPGSGSFASSRIILPNSATMLFPDTGGFTSIHMASSDFYDFSIKILHKYELFSWTEIWQFQSISCKRDHGISNARPTRSASFWIILLLFLSGNIHPNPGPEMIDLLSPNDLKDSSGLRFIHVNVRSLFNKIDAICLWAKLTESDIIVLSETWLKPSITSNMIHIEGYNLFRMDRVGKGG